MNSPQTAFFLILLAIAVLISALVDTLRRRARLAAGFEVASLRLQPGDVLVLRIVGHDLTAGELNNLRKRFQGVLPPYSKVIVLDRHAELTILSGIASAEPTVETKI